MSDQRRTEPGDEELEGALRRTLGLVTAQQRELAIAAFGLRRLDEELAELLADTRQGAALAVRSDDLSSSFQLAMKHGEHRFTVDVERSAADELTIVTTLETTLPPDRGQVRTADGTTYEAERRGQSLISHNVPARMAFRVELDLPDGTTVVSPWIGP